MDRLVNALYSLAVFFAVLWIVTIAVTWEDLTENTGLLVVETDLSQFLLVIAQTSALGIIAAVCVTGGLIAQAVITYGEAQLDRPQL